MLLTIPVLDLLYSQLDIGVDPSSGKLTCNIKDIPARQRLPLSSNLGDLALTLQSSSEAGEPGTLCIRISQSPVASSNHSPINLSEAPQFHALGPPDQSDHAVHSLPGPPLISTAHDSYSAVDAYTNSACGQGPLETIMNQESLWASLQEKAPQQSDDLGGMSPLSQTLSFFTTGSMIDNLGTYSSPGLYPFNDAQFDSTIIQADHTMFSTGNAPYHCPPDQINNMLDIQGVPEAERTKVDATPGGSFSIMDLFSSAPHSESSSRTSSAPVSPMRDQIVLESRTSSPTHRQRSSTRERYATTPPSSHVDPPAEPARETKRESYPCPFPSCGRILKSMYTQQIHLKTHESKPQKSFPCTMGCSESFTRHHDRLRHEVAQHGKQCEFSCKRCERFFSSQRMLDRHTCWSWRNGSLRWQLKDFADASRSET